jgi:uncharacterized protein
MVTKAEPTLKNLSVVERTAVQDFLARVQSAYGKRIQRAMLFGSKARGEANADSDIDVLLIVADETWQFTDEICNVSADVSLKYDVLLDVRVIGATRWQYMSEIRAGLYQNISREAIPLGG